MAKTMARIKDGVVTNMEWVSDAQAETDTLKNVGGVNVSINDTYSNGKFYRDGELMLTALEEYQKRITELDEAYEEGVNSI